MIQDKQLAADGNNFTLVRLVLASAVIYTHCYWIYFGAKDGDDLSAFLGAPVSAYAVDGFFFLSGFLVYPSLLRLGKSSSFLLARFVRIWPGLAVCVALSVLVGLTLTTTPGLAYFGGETARFVAGNLSFVSASYMLTGVICEDRLCTVNGSLWTLPWEVRCYLLLALLGFLGLARPKAMKRLVLPASFLAAIIWDIAAIQDAVSDVAGPGAVYLISMFDRLWTLFALGVAAFLFRKSLHLSWWILAMLFGLNLLGQSWDIGGHLRAIFTGYAVLCLGILTAQRGSISKDWPDYSYGMYIYAFPTMILLDAIWLPSSHLLLALANFALTLPLAALSWHMVERPALSAYRKYIRPIRSEASEVEAGRKPAT